MVKIITTVGTSLLDNLGLEFKDLNRGYYRYKDRRKKEVEKIIKNLKEKMDEFNCAEIDTLKKIIEKYPHETFEIILIATDTLKGYIVAEVLKEYFKNNNFDGKIEKVNFSEDNVIEGLNVEDGDSFVKDGLLNLFDFLKNFGEENLGMNNVLFNISGGYKGVIPFLTIIAQIYRVPLFYTYEKSEVLITIPQLPINIDWSVFIKYRDLIEKLKNGMELNESFYNFKLKNGYLDFPDIIYEVEDNGMYLVSLSPIGEWLLEEFKKYLLVKVVKNSKFYSENKGNKREIEDVLLELEEKLKDRIENEKINNTEQLLKFLKEKVSDNDDLKHGGNFPNNAFIFKSTNKNQIRLLYSPEIQNGDLILKLIDYKRGNFNHSEYIDEFRKVMKNMNSEELNDVEILPIRRNYV